MKVEGEYSFSGPREDVWALLHDPEALAAALPGTQSLQKMGDDTFEGVMNVRIGPVAGAFSGRLVLSDEVPPERCTLSMEGRGAPGFAQGSGQAQLLDAGDGKTLLKYTGDVQVGGRLANVGQRMIDSVSRSMIRQGLDNLDGALRERLAARAAGVMPQYESRSEVAFATAVAHDVAGELVAAADTRRLLYLVPVLAVLVLAVFLIARGLAARAR